MTHTNEERYLFLRDYFALYSADDEEEFKHLAHLTGTEFDNFVDSAIDKQTSELTALEYAA